MRRILMVTSLVAVVAAPTLATPSLAAARDYCGDRAHSRRVTGTVLGGVGGALIGQAITHNTMGTLLGGAGGALAGNQIARTSCDRTHYSARTRTRYTHRRSEPRYYDNASYAAAGGCHYENRPYYDERGQLIYQPTQVCR